MEPSPLGPNTKPLGKPSEPPQVSKVNWFRRISQWVSSPSRNGLILLSGISLFLLVLASLGGWYWLNLRQKNALGVLPPNLSITPPASLAELATQYPELASILQDPELDSAYKDFLLAYQQGGEDAALEMARSRGLINQNEELRITLELDTTDSAALVAQLEAQGVKVTAVSDNLVDIAVPLALIQEVMQKGDPGALFRGITALDHVKRVRLPRTSIQHDAGVFLRPLYHRPLWSMYPGIRELKNAFWELFGTGLKAVSSNTIESLDKINVPAWHAAGYTGQGIKIGILDMGFNKYRSFLGSELPENVTVRSFIAGVEIDDTDTEHGTACAEIIHDIAPDAELFLAAYETDVEQRQAVDWLVAQGVNIISHSAGSIYGPMDGTGPEAEMVDKVVAGGILWVNSAGNMAEAHYRGKFTDKDGDGFHEFKPGDELLGFIPDGRVVMALNWDAWDTGDQDYDLYILDKDNNEVVSSENIQNGPGAEAAEFISYYFLDNGPYYVAFRARHQTRPAVFDLYVYNAVRMEYTNAEYSITTPADARSALTVGATYWKDDSLEDYSSQGPSHDERIKPDISAPAGVTSAVYGEEFAGTSASAPHVAAAAALVWQAFPSFNVQQVNDYLKNQAKDLGTPGADSQFGFGRLQLGDPPAVGAPPPTESAPTELSATVEPLIETPLPPVDTEELTATPGEISIAPPENPEPPQVEAPPDDSGLVLDQNDLLLISIGLVGCVGLPGVLGVGGLVAAGVIWSSRRRSHQPRPPAAPGSQLPVGVQGQPGNQAYRAKPAAQPPAAVQGPGVFPLPGAPGAGSTAGESRCPRCGSRQRIQARFCTVCGASLDASAAQPIPGGPGGLSQYCTRCGMALRPTGKFCPRCGQPRLNG
jgi:subtilisin family serine protease